MANAGTCAVTPHGKNSMVPAFLTAQCGPRHLYPSIWAEATNTPATAAACHLLALFLQHAGQLGDYMPGPTSILKSSQAPQPGLVSLEWAPDLI